MRPAAVLEGVLPIIRAARCVLAMQVVEAARLVKRAVRRVAENPRVCNPRVVNAIVLQCNDLNLSPVGGAPLVPQTRRSWGSLAGVSARAVRPRRCAVEAW